MKATPLERYLIVTIICIGVVTCFKFLPGNKTYSSAEYAKAVQAAEARGHGTGWNDYNGILQRKLAEHEQMRIDSGDKAGLEALRLFQVGLKKTLEGK